MLKQIFKKNVPQKLLFDLLDQICLKTDKYYMIDMNAYKKMLFYKFILSWGLTGSSRSGP